MTAWADIQESWAKSNENKLITRILLCDLSAAFDTLDAKLLCEKLKIYGFDQISIDWFNLYLTGRSQSIKIGSSLSKKLT
jgi:hypothetical protein